MFKPMGWSTLVALGVAALGVAVLGVGCASAPAAEPALPEEPAPTDPGAVGAEADEEQLVCTKMGCGSGFRVALDVDVWPSGRYVFTVESDGGGRTVCEGGLPLNSCELGGNIKCDGGEGPNPRGVQIGEFGCDLPAGKQRWDNIQIEGVPKSVSVSIQVNGSDFASASFTPEYETLTPNGVKCGPVCEQGSGLLRVGGR